MRNTFLVITLLYANFSISEVITVKQDGSGDFTTIQQAVNYASDGDSVLVWPGRYYENIVINDKSITVGSLTLTTGLTSYVGQTIIDGNYQASCISLRNCLEGVTINGFTIVHGSGTLWGYICGGGMFIFDSKAEIYNCRIKDNKVSGYGGGIFCKGSEVFLSSVSILNNWTHDWGGGIHILSSDVEFDSANRCNIYENYAATGTDLFKHGIEDSLYLYVDTFTVFNPDYYYLYSESTYGYPQDDIICSINEASIDAVSEDLYVSPDGSDENSGLTPDEPLKTITYALLKLRSDSLTPDTIHLASGNYSMSSGEKFPLSLKRNANIKGINRDSCILDGEDEIDIMRGIPHANDYQISNLTIQNGNGNKYPPVEFGVIRLVENNRSEFCNVLFQNNKGTMSSIGFVQWSNNFALHHVSFINNVGGRALRFGSSKQDTVRLYNCRFEGNIPDYSNPDEGHGGACVLIGSNESADITGYFFNCLFIENHKRVFGSNAIGLIDGAQAYVVNCTFGDNTSDDPGGGNIGVLHNSDLHLYNSILYHNEPAELYMSTSLGTSFLNIYHSLIEGGEDSIRIYTSGNTVNYDPSNINTDPMWDTASMYPYSLSGGSPCIDAGTLDLPEGVELPETDLAGNPRIYNGYVDMGAYEYGPWVGIPDHKVRENPVILLQAVPNPFHYKINIAYTVHEKGHLIINVYDMRGQRISTLVNTEGLPGKGTIEWFGNDENENKIPPGAYIISLTINGKERGTMKVVRF